MAKHARKKKPRSGERDDSPGLAVRRVAADVVEGVLNRHRALDEMLEGSDARAATAALAALDDRDRGLTRAIVAVVLRRLGTLRHLLGSFLEEGLPAQAPRVEIALLIGAAQILFLEVPDHAAVDLAVRLAREDRMALHFAGLINAVLRRIAREGKERIAALDAPVLDTPPWLMARWIKTYGEATAHAIAAANGREPALDLTVKSDAEAWAAKLDGRVLPTGSVRTIVHGAVTALPGFDEGAWWVQDAAASIPARFSATSQACASPICAPRPAARRRSLLLPAPKSRRSIARRRGSSGCRKISPACRSKPSWSAPMSRRGLRSNHSTPSCSMRRARRPAPSAAIPTCRGSSAQPTSPSLAALQRRLLDHAITLTKPGGTLVYCTCSLEPEEGTDIVADLLAREQSVRRVPIAAAEVFGEADFINADGDLRTLPCHFTDADSRFAGVDGFYAARLEKR